MSDAEPTHERQPATVVYSLPRAAAERALERQQFQADENGEDTPALEELVYDEIDERPVFLVDGESLEEFARQHGD